MRKQISLGMAAGLVTILSLATAYGQSPKDGRGPRVDKAPKVADTAPLFKLKSMDGKSETELGELCKTKPVVLIFGSYT